MAWHKWSDFRHMTGNLSRRVSKKCRPHLLVGRVVFLTLTSQSFGPAQASDSELHGNWHQFLLVIARSRVASMFWLFSGKSSFSVRLPSSPVIAHKPESSALHWHLRSTRAFQNWPIMCHAFQVEAIRFPFFLHVERPHRYLTVVFESPTRRSWLAACPSPDCTDVDPPPRATTTFSSFFRFSAMPVAAIALSICSFSSAASARIVSTPPKSSKLQLRFESLPAVVGVRCLPVTLSMVLSPQGCAFWRGCIGVVHSHASPRVFFAFHT